MTERLRVLVGAYVVRGPMGAMTWHYLQYALGLRALGHEVHVVEDSGDDPWSCWDPVRGTNDEDPTYGLAYATDAYARVGLGDRWAYFDAHTGAWRGPASDRIAGAIRDADLFINVSGAPPVRDWFEHVPARAFVDTDPGFRQIRHLTVPEDRALAQAHTSFHTFGERVGADGCLIPDDGFRWRPTRQPVVLDAWPVLPVPRGAPFTTVMQWDSYATREHGALRLGMKSASFAGFARLPQRAEAPLEVAASGSVPADELRALGWRVRDPQEAAPDPFAFRRYVQASAGEVTVAKHGYVATCSGWFSERSAVYLASGRPVITQDTGFSALLPSGHGLFAVDDEAGAAAAIEAVTADLDGHARAARGVAEEHFDARRVLPALLDDALVSAG